MTTLDEVQHILVVRPAFALARVVRGGDGAVVDASVRGLAIASRWTGNLIRRAQNGLATTYVAWLMLGAVLAGVAGLMLS